MQPLLLQLLRCPVTRTNLQLQIISESTINLNGEEIEIIKDGILYADEDWFYPVINGIPRLIVEAFIDYESFLSQWLPDYNAKSNKLKKKYHDFIQNVVAKNRHSKQSFTREWSFFNYEQDKTWNADTEGMLQRFLDETQETTETLKGKLIFDAGCGNGLLNQFVARCGATIIGVDFGLNIERAYQKNTEQKAFFIQGDIQFPPFAIQSFDIVHSSGVLHHTNDTEHSFSCIESFVKPEGKLSVWLYHPRKDFIHNLINSIRKVTSKLPTGIQYYLYRIILLPFAFIIKRLRGNKQNTREMMINIFDWFSPEFRWEHEPAEVVKWFNRKDYSAVCITTTDIFGFNITGIKNKLSTE